MSSADDDRHLFPVERGHLLLFSRALGDPTADATDFTTAIAAPTFAAAHVQFLPHFQLRPEPGVAWLGSGRSDSGADAGGFAAALHAEQSFDYWRPLRAGMVLDVRTVDGATWTKPRRDGGQLAFSESVTEFHDSASGTLVQTARQVAVVIGSTPAEPSGDAPPPAASVPAAEDGARLIGLPEVGDSRQLVVFDDLSRTQLVMYSGASGDYNPLHTDEIFATRVTHYPSVFAHGMLTMGASARVLTEWVDQRLLRSYRVQFRGQVWPGDSLTVTATVQSRSSASALIALTTTTQDGRTVLTGHGVFGAPAEG